jgi:hypothetical protein
VPLSWNEIRHRAIALAREWKGETREAAERQTFWKELFNVFGVRRRTVATFEEPVKKLSGDWGFIDLFWPGRVVAAHRSAGGDLGKARARDGFGPLHLRRLVAGRMCSASSRGWCFRARLTKHHRAAEKKWC